jgi:hypothetical protein
LNCLLLCSISITVDGNDERTRWSCLLEARRLEDSSTAYPAQTRTSGCFHHPFGCNWRPGAVKRRWRRGWWKCRIGRRLPRNRGGATQTSRDDKTSVTTLLEIPDDQVGDAALKVTVMVQGLLTWYYSSFPLLIVGTLTDPIGAPFSAIPTESDAPTAAPQQPQQQLRPNLLCSHDSTERLLLLYSCSCAVLQFCFRSKTNVNY